MESKLLEHLIAIRRQIHANPELGYHEIETSNLISGELCELNIPFCKNIAKTGIIGILKKGEGPCIALRADMDALPMEEKTNLSFKSIKKGILNNKEVPIMHACGHDIHTTILLGAIHLLKYMPFNGTIKFLFQPSEEGVYDDLNGRSGGDNFVNLGVLDNVQSAIGLHVHPQIPVGKMAFKTGPALASTCFFEIEIIGRSSHAGVAPQNGIDAIYISGQLITAIQAVVTRYSSPTEPRVISITKINGGVAPNVIANKVILEGTIRAFDEITYAEMLKRLEDILNGFAISFGAEIKIRYPLNYPTLMNDEKIHFKLLDTLNQVFGKENIVPVGQLLGGEDFAFIARKIPSFFYYLGARDTNLNVHNIHEEEVIFNEDCIPYGSTFLANAAVELLKKIN